MSEEKVEIVELSHSELFEINLDRFIEELSALDDTLPIQMLFLNVKRKSLLEDLEKISDKEEDKNEDGVEIIRYKVKPEFSDKFPKVHKHLNRSDIALKILPRNYIVSIISQYDAYLGELIRILFQINPNLLKSSEKELKVEDLFQYDSVEELKLHIIDKEVDSVLRDEHFEQLKSIEKRISNATGKNFTLTTDLPVLCEFVELTQRRNLFVHTNGQTTRQYCDAYKKWKIQNECNGEINYELVADSEYCKRAFEILYEMAVKLTHVLWRKFVPKEREKADWNLNLLTYDLLKDSKYELAITLLEFATDVIKRFETEQIRKFMVVNKAIAYKMLDKEQECHEVLEKEDWSIGNEYKLANMVLRDQFDKAAELMIKIGPNDEIVSKFAFKDWPLFKRFRKSEEFKIAYKKVFGEDFRFEEIQDKKKIEESKKHGSKEEE